MACERVLEISYFEKWPNLFSSLTRDRSQTLVKGVDAKIGPLKVWTLKGALNKITAHFPVKI